MPLDIANFAAQDAEAAIELPAAVVAGAAAGATALQPAAANAAYVHQDGTVATASSTPAQAPGYQWAINVRDGAYGAKGDRTTDDAPLIQAALDAGYQASLPVYIPAAPANGSNRGYYLCNSPLKYHPGQVILGDGAESTEIRFLNDTHGLMPASLTAFQTHWQIKGLRLRGRADTSTSATWTAGLLMLGCQFDAVQDVTIDRFVDGVVADGTIVGAGDTPFRGITVLTGGYPNFTNRYPRYLFHVCSDGTPKGQGINVESMSLFGNGSGGTTTATATGSAGQMIGPVSCGIGLWAESGIKVFSFNDTTKLYTRLVSGTDYKLHANTSGGTVLTPNTINVGGTRNSSPVTSVYVELLGTLAGATTVKVSYNDPTAKKGLYIEYGNENRFRASTIGGAETCVQFSDTGVYVTVLAADGTGNANNNLRFSTSYQAGTVSIVYVAGTPGTATTTAVATGAPNYTVTVTLAADGGGNVLATANDVIDAIRSDPTSYSLLDVRGVTFTAGAGPYPAAVQGQRSDNTGRIAAMTAKLLATANAQFAGQNEVVVQGLQIANLGMKYGSQSPGSTCYVDNYTRSNVVALLSRDPQAPGQAQGLKANTSPGDGRQWFSNEKTAAQVIASGSFTTVTWDVLPDTHSAATYLYYDSGFGAGGREIEFEGDIEIATATGQFDAEVQLQQSLDNGGTWTALKTVEVKDNFQIPAYTLTNWASPGNVLRSIDRNSFTLANVLDVLDTLINDLENNVSVTRRRALVFAYEDNTIINPLFTDVAVLYRVQAKVVSGSSITFCGPTDDTTYPSRARLKVRDTNLV